MKKKYRNILDVSLSESNSKLPYYVRRKGYKELKKANKYPVDIYNELKTSIAEAYGINNNCIFIGNGLDGIILCICLLLKNEKKVLTCKGSFQGYRLSAEACGMNVIELDLKNKDEFANGLISEINSNIGIVFISNPNNPLGFFLSQESCLSIVSKAQKNDTIVVIDEAYIDFVETGEKYNMIKLYQKYNNIIILRSFSKGYGIAGLRCGFAISNKDTISSLFKISGPLPYRVNRVACRVAVELLNNSKKLIKLRKKVNLIKQYTYKLLESCNIRYYKSEANFILIEIDTDINVDILIDTWTQ